MRVGVASAVQLHWSDVVTEARAWLTDDATEAVVMAPSGLTLGTSSSLWLTPRRAGVWPLWVELANAAGCRAQTGIVRQVTVTP